MALPTLVKTWNFDVNNPSQGVPVSVGDAVTKWAQTWLNLKNDLVAISSPGWTIAGSGGAGAGGGGAMDGTDRWTVAGDITITQSGTTGNSWIVLQNNAIRTGFQVLIQPQETGGGWPSAAYTAVSPGGNYTGGGETTLPTASDQIVLRDDDVNSDSFPETPAYHIEMSSDGQSTRWWFNWGNVTRAFWAFEVPANIVSGWTDPWVGIAVYGFSIGGAPRYEELAEQTTFTRSSVGSTTMPLYLTSEAWNFDASDSAAGQRMTFGNDLENGEFPIVPIGLASETTGVRGRHGELVDMWWGSTIIPDTAHYPDTLPRQFVQLGNLIVPWNTAAGKMLTV